MKCPVCSVDLNMMDRQGVEVDYCPKCRGIWLDRGELDRIVERSASPQPRPRPEESDRRDHHDDHYRQEEHRSYGAGKKQGFLGRMLDFD